MITPIVAQGVIARRPRVVALAGMAGTDGRGVRILQELRERYGPGPLLLRIPFRPMALVLTPEHVQRVLTGSPEPFATANTEKRGALDHFEPHGSLISHGAARADRRRWNEAVLETDRPLHSQADAISRAVRDEARLLREAAGRGDGLDWDYYITSWWRVVRRVVFGDGARDDHDLTDMLTRLRSSANWAGFAPVDLDLRARFRARVEHHLGRAEPGSLAAMMAAVPTTPDTDPADQVAHWLFAFEAAGSSGIRALALLATHPEEARQLPAEIGGDDAGPQDLPRLRASVLESLRLWPTAPMILRDTTTDTTWDGAVLPAGTAVLVASWFFQRDAANLPGADRFEPDRWISGDARDSWALVPFSGGPGHCPGQELVLFTTSTFLAGLLHEQSYTLAPPPRMGSEQPLPGGLNPYALRFTTRDPART